MKILKTKPEDIPAIMKIIENAKIFLKKEGVDQWQNNYPNKNTLKKDIKNNNSYLIKEGDKVIAAAAIIIADDPTYDYLEAGEWLSSNKYAVIHRAVVADAYKGQGIVSKIFNLSYQLALNKNAGSIRIDTHPDNKAMKKVIAKEGFKYCGVIYTENGSKRDAYEKIL